MMAQIDGTPDPSGPQPLPPSVAPHGPSRPGVPGPVPAGWQPAPPGLSPAVPRPRSRKGLWIALSAVAVVFVVLIGCVVGAIVGRPDSKSDDWLAQDPTKPPADAVQISRQDVHDLIEARNTALKAKDIKGFLASVDQGNADLTAAQTRLFNNLQKIPFSESRYEVAGQQGRTTDEFGRGVTITAYVAFAHQIDGFDASPVAELYSWALTKKDKSNPPVITAVGGAPPAWLSSSAESKTEFYPAPWDKWTDMTVVRTPHVLMMADSAQAARAQQYAPIAEQAAVDDVAAWQATGQPMGSITQRFVTALVPTNDEFGQLYEISQKSLSEVAGHSMPLPQYPQPSGKGAVIGTSRVVMDLSSPYFTSGRQADATEIFRHEYAHSMVELLDRYDNPDSIFTGQQEWIIEGFAEYIANHGATGPTSRTPHARQVIRGGKFDGHLPSSMLWDAKGVDVDFNYWLGHQAIRYMATTYGEPKAFAFVAAYYQGASVQDAFGRVLSTDPTIFEQGWASFVRVQAN